MYSIKIMAILVMGLLCTSHAHTQHITNDSLSLNIDSIIEPPLKKSPLKLIHAEPLYIDLIRDLGALKGEKEWNIGVGLTDKTTNDEYTALIEYEFAPVDRLGLEVELPFSFYYPVNGRQIDSISKNKLNSIKLAGQYTFLVSEKIKTSLAIGYIHEFTLNEFKNYKSSVFEGNVFNPFFIAAKRWGKNFHTLLYTGPEIFKQYNQTGVHKVWQVNSNFHYMIPASKNFIGIEFNKEVWKHHFDMVIRPQMRLVISDQLMIGIVTGIPISRSQERFSSFLRLIYEPAHK